MLSKDKITFILLVIIFIISIYMGFILETGTIHLQDYIDSVPPLQDYIDSVPPLEESHLVQNKD